MELEAASLEELMARNGHEWLAILKIDIDGNEWSVLEALCARKCLQGKANIELPEVAQDQAKMKPAAGSRL